MANATPTVDLTRAAADARIGRQLYEQTCVVCHGEDGLGGHGGGAPLDKVGGFDAVVDVVRSGRNYMPEFSTLLMPEQIRDIAAYVAERFAAGGDGAATP